MSMILMGIADEAGASVDIQIRATRELGWECLEARNMQAEGFATGNIHDIPEAAFDQIVRKLEAQEIQVYCFGSTIGNWAKKIEDPFALTLTEVQRAIPRMQRLGCRFIRIMSYAIRDGEEQMEEERFRRVREITRMFLDAGIQPVHENCMNYGGMGWPFMLRLLENAPGLKVVFDTGNPVFNLDRSQPKPWPRQDAWEFYSHVKPFVAHVHVKDAVWNPAKNDADYTYPGDGDGQVRRILADLVASGYAGGVSIEPHLAVVFHDASVTASADAQYRTFIEYGRRLMALLEQLRAEPQPGQPSGPVPTAR